MNEINCTDCGVCCMEQGSPPGYVYIHNGGVDWPDEEDVERFNQLPTKARVEIKKYADRLKSQPPRSDGPCIWLDRESKQCRYYEHRPNICRDLDVGSEGCRFWRSSYKIDLYSIV